MRSRRSLPLGSPSSKERTGDDSRNATTTARTDGNKANLQSSRVRTRQIPLASRAKDSSVQEQPSKRTRRTSRGLPLSRSVNVVPSDSAVKPPPDAQAVGHDEKNVKDPPVEAETELKEVPSAAPNGKAKLTNGQTSSSLAITSSKKRLLDEAKPGTGNSELMMINKDGLEVRIKLIVGKKEFCPKTDEPQQRPPIKGDSLGNDGNQFYCEVCGEFGDVVCCDGCPKVYHQECIPLSHSDRKLITNDEEPWFCPSCTEERNNGTKAGTGGKALRRSPNPMEAAGAETESLADDDTHHQCEVCGRSTDMPYYNEAGDTLCSNCFATENEAEVQNGDVEASEELTQPHFVQSKRSDRKRKLVEVEEEKPDKVPKKKKKKKKPHSDSIDTSEPPFEPPALPIQGPPGRPGIAQATPAFYFYLAENRAKIERVLSRRNRNFNRLSKASEKNALIAKEAAEWWSRLRPVDQKRYMNMSMRDFEGRIIEWKEDKNIREMNSNEVDLSENSSAIEQRLVEEDEKLTWKRHQRLYLSTSVGSKPFKPEPDQAYNRVLQDLLHDMRFHPLPMLSVDKHEEEEVKDDVGVKVLIPYIDVHGPSSTSVGDVCMGCMRSWNHCCPVLQRRLPAVEHRSKLQPPMSSLLATRVGLGLRPRLVEEPGRHSASAKEPDLFAWRVSKDREEMLSMKILPSCTLTCLNERMDDIVLFVEETTAMKVPEPSRPDSNSKSQLRSLPLSAVKPEDSTFKKCGRCRAIIQGDTGCVQCRRAQLVINMAKRQKQDGKLIKVHTSMLGRCNTKETSEAQGEEDAAVAAAMLKERWTPCAVLPAEPKYAPRRSTSNQQSTPQHEESKEIETLDDDNDEEPSEELESAAPNESVADREGRARPSRSAAALHDLYEPHERQEIMEKNRKAVNAFQKKLVSVACCGLFQALVRRDPLKLFDQPVSDEAYYDVIKQPIFFCNIRDKILNSQYASLFALANDVKQLVDNALSYNLPNSIYVRTATELMDLFNIMHKRAGHWITAMKDCFSNYLQSNQVQTNSNDDEICEEAFADLSHEWPEAYRLLKSADWLKNHVSSDLLRTEENEIAYFGSLAVSRVAVAAEACLAPYTDMGGCFGVVTKRTEQEDRELRERVDGLAGSIIGPLDLSTPSTWREESVHRLLRKVQSRKLDRVTASAQGCARCDGLIIDRDVKLSMKAEAAVGKSRKNLDSDLPRVDGSRIDLSTGRGSFNARAGINKRRKESEEEQYDSVVESCVSVRGSRIHGLGLFADQEFKKGDVVAEYVGEYIGTEEFEKREEIYRENRTQDYSFRIGPESVIDATRRGGPGRYANHDCSPNCASKIISGKEPTPHLKRVMIIALRNIKINEEITYDYQFPLEQDLTARVPCACRSVSCRGFMNWDLPEKGSNNRVVLVQKRGANMRDRIRRLNRPLKRDEM